MSTVPEAAVEAAAQTLVVGMWVKADHYSDLTAATHAALHAAMPVIRQAIAAEIVSDGPKHPYNADETARINAWCAGLHAAARLVRGDSP